MTSPTPRLSTLFSHSSAASSDWDNPSQLSQTSIFPSPALDLHVVSTPPTCLETVGGVCEHSTPLRMYDGEELATLFLTPRHRECVACATLSPAHRRTSNTFPFSKQARPPRPRCAQQLFRLSRYPQPVHEEMHPIPRELCPLQAQLVAIDY